MGAGLAPGTHDAVALVSQIMSAIGLNIPMSVYRGGVPNASATIIGGYPAIVYNGFFLNGLSPCNQWAGVTVLAHEVGHHANRDTNWAAQFTHPWQKELGADWVSGLAMRRLGRSLNESLSGIACGMGPFSPGSPSHPNSQLRLQAIEQGWYAG